MIIDERISMSLADKVEVWLDFLQEQSNDEEGIEYTRLVLEYGCSLVDYRYEIRKPNEANVDVEGVGSSYDVIDRVGDILIDYIEALGNGEFLAGRIDCEGVRNIYEQNKYRSIGNGWHYYNSTKIIRDKHYKFGWRYPINVY